MIEDGFIKNTRDLNILTYPLFADVEFDDTEDDTLFTKDFVYTLKSPLLDMLDNIIIHAKEKESPKDASSCNISFKKYKTSRKTSKKSPKKY